MTYNIFEGCFEVDSNTEFRREAFKNSTRL